MIQDFFSYDRMGGTLTYDIGQQKNTLSLGGIIAAVFYNNEQRILCIYLMDKKQQLAGFDVEGNKLFDCSPPENHEFWYLSDQKLQIACVVLDDSKAKPSGRSGWWFSVDPDDGSFKRGDWVY